MQKLCSTICPSLFSTTSSSINSTPLLEVSNLDSNNNTTAQWIYRGSQTIIGILGIVLAADESSDEFDLNKNAKIGMSFGIPVLAGISYVAQKYITPPCNKAHKDDVEMGGGDGLANTSTSSNSIVIADDSNTNAAHLVAASFDNTSSKSRDELIIFLDQFLIFVTLYEPLIESQKETKHKEFATALGTLKQQIGSAKGTLSSKDLEQSQETSLISAIGTVRAQIETFVKDKNVIIESQKEGLTSLLSQFEDISLVFTSIIETGSDEGESATYKQHCETLKSEVAKAKTALETVQTDALKTSLSTIISTYKSLSTHIKEINLSNKTFLEGLEGRTDGYHTENEDNDDDGAADDGYPPKIKRTPFKSPQSTKSGYSARSTTSQASSSNVMKGLSQGTLEGLLGGIDEVLQQANTTRSKITFTKEATALKLTILPDTTAEDLVSLPKQILDLLAQMKQ